MDEEAHSSGKSQYYRTKLVFSGKKIHFPVWEEKFLAKSQKKGYCKTLLGNTTIPKESDIINEKLLSKERKKRSSVKPTMIVSKTYY
jgi:hypothetical protein